MTTGPVQELESAQVGDDTESVGSDQPGDDDTGDDQRHPADHTLNARRAWARRVASHWRLIVISLLFVAAAAAAAGLYFGQYRHDQQTNDAAAKSAISAASQGTVALLSYAPDKLESDLVAAKSHLTGEFLNYYSKFTEQIVVPAAKAKAVDTKAAVMRAVVVELHPESARILVFLDQTTTSKDAPEPVQTASSVLVGLAKVHDSWLISAFDPI